MFAYDLTVVARNPCQRWAIIIGFCANEDSILENRLTRG